MPEGLPEAGYEMIHGRLTNEQRKGAFKPEVDVAADASTQEKLLAYAGRDPSSSRGRRLASRGEGGTAAAAAVNQPPGSYLDVAVAFRGDEVARRAQRAFADIGEQTGVALLPSHCLR